MSCVPTGASARLRFWVLGLAAIFAFTTFTIDDADARSRRKRSVKKAHITYVKRARPVAHPIGGSRYAAIVVDAKTGKVLHEANPDGPRHPASLTKIMTLYLLFEQLEAGKIRLGTQMPVSAFAASQAPTKLGLRPGQTLAVEDAIKALVTKSANDAAVVIAETLAGSESEFARQMTRKAHALGMIRTVYRNASGLPNDDQVTTAREQALLGLAIQQRFPRYYRYFATASFVYRGRAMRNHNHLLGSVAGVDGIKTGYTNASGFNLVTSMWRGERHVVAVVLGGATGGQRDARMRELLAAHIMEASAQPGSPAPTALAAATTRPATIRVPDPAANIGAVPPDPEPGSNAPIKPVVVKTVMVRLATVQPLSAKPQDTNTVAAPAVTDTKPAPQLAPAPVAAPAKPEVLPPPPPPARKPSVAAMLPAAVAAARNAIVSPAAAADRPAIRSGWAIQIGAFEDEGEARQRLAAAKAKAAAVLRKADAYTERTVKGSKTFYRARFAGFDRDAATAACKALKRSEIVCMPTKI